MTNFKFGDVLLIGFPQSGSSHRKQGEQNYFRQNRIAVGTALTGGPPHRSVRAELPHTAPTWDVDVQSVHWDRDAGFSASATSVC